MTDFHLIALIMIICWLVLIAVRFHHSLVVLAAGLVVVGVYTLAALAFGMVTMNELGLGFDRAWLPALGWTCGWLILMFTYSPLADWLATRWIGKPPTLGTFRVLQQSRLKLIGGIVVAWVLGGMLEELTFRGIVLTTLSSWLSPWFGKPIAVVVAILFAAFGAGHIHQYQGSRAVVIITQLSILFGILFVVSGYNLWTAVVCHGIYDTVAFILFASKRSRYSHPGHDTISSPGT